jgi:hypothetical protein
MSTESNGISAAEFRALGRLMRFARSQGYTYYVTTFLGATDWTWSKDHVYAVVAVPRAEGWHVDLPTAHVDMRPASVQQLTDVLVAVGLLPVDFSSIAADYDARIRDLVEWADGEQRDEIDSDEVLGLLQPKAVSA